MIPQTDRKFGILRPQNNGYTFINPYSRKVLESSGGQINLDGNLIKTYSQNGTKCSNWVFNKEIALKKIKR